MQMKGRDIWIIFPVFCVCLGELVWEHRNDAWPTMRIVGLCLMIFGFLMWALARINLGASFSVEAKATALVTRGLYSRIRNPIYVFGSVMIVGLCLFFLHPQFLLIFLVLIPVQIIRARRESAVLEAAFGDQYREYKRRTWF
jgi:protein-S-isoprenylcysteine O-methyltransferase Ste14